MMMSPSAVRSICKSPLSRQNWKDCSSSMSIAGRVWTISGSCPMIVPCCAMWLHLAKTSPLQQAACHPPFNEEGKAGLPWRPGRSRFRTFGRGDQRKSGTRRGSNRFSLGCIGARRRGDTTAKTGPKMQRQQAQPDDQKLAPDKRHQPFEGRIHKAVGVQADAEHVHAEPREARDDIAEYRHGHQAAVPDQSAPARVQNDRVPQHDNERAVLLRVPAPEPAPGLIGPNAAEHGAREAEQGGETHDAVNHFGERLAHIELARTLSCRRCHSTRCGRADYSTRLNS